VAGARNRGRTGYVITVALTATLGLILSVVGLLLIVGSLAAGTGRNWDGAAIALAILAVGVLFLSEALRRDRRRRHGLYQAARADSSGQQIGRRPLMHSPIVLGVSTVIMTGLAIAAIVSAVQLHSQSGVSAYTQSTGLRRDALVSAVRTIEHQNRSSTWYTAEISAVLAQPVAGHLTTTLWVPYSVSAKRGQLIQVLVDPRQPSYSEIPGAPYVTASQWITQVVVAAVAVVLAALVGWGTVDATRAWRRWKALSQGVVPNTGADSAVLG
jgi:membrane protein implicated in regulation of membrane protease activity